MALTVATEVLLLLHEPEKKSLDNVVEVETQKEVAPEIVAISLNTLT